MSKSLFWKMMDGELPLPKAALALGANIVEVSPEAGTIEVEFEGKPEFTNPIGSIQGGFLAAMLDDTMGPALTATLAAGEFAPTLELKTSFIAPAAVGKLVGHGRVVSKGGSVCFLEGELMQGDKLVAKATATAIIRKIKKLIEVKMQAEVKRGHAAEEYMTQERCAILEVANDTADAAVSIARARVKAGITTAWHKLSGVTERYLIIAGQGEVEVGELAPVGVAEGDVVRIPADTAQRITNTGATDLIFMPSVRRGSNRIVMSRWSKIAYGDLRDDGYIDHFFCDPDRQRRGVGSLLIKGFAVVKEQLVTVRGQTLKNFIMQKVHLMALVFDRVSKWIGDEHHVREASFTFETGSFNVLLGRTLAGKTTLLRLMAGLERPSAGRILLGEADVTGIAVRDRNVAMVYQQFINYPNFTVYDNIASPLKVAGLTPAAVDRRVRETAEMLRIEGLLERKPLALSGGQQQRTAMARALVKDADLVLLDEPLVNLDYKLREELRFDMRELFEARRTIAVYASTEPGEALALGGNTTLVHEGRVLQSGVTGDVYRRPNSVVAAHLFSEPPINIVAGRVADGVVEITGGARFAVNRDLGKIGAGHYQFGVRAHHIALQAANDDDLVLEGRVELAEISGSETFLHLNCAGISLVAHLPGIASFDVDDVITVYVPTHKLFVFDARGALRVAPSGPAVGVASG